MSGQGMKWNKLRGEESRARNLDGGALGSSAKKKWSAEEDVAVGRYLAWSIDDAIGYLCNRLPRRQSGEIRVRHAFLVAEKAKADQKPPSQAGQGVSIAARLNALRKTKAAKE